MSFLLSEILVCRWTTHTGCPLCSSLTLVTSDQVLSGHTDLTVILLAETYLFSLLLFFLPFLYFFFFPFLFLKLYWCPWSVSFLGLGDCRKLRVADSTRKCVVEPGNWSCCATRLAQGYSFESQCNKCLLQWSFQGLVWDILIADHRFHCFLIHLTVSRVCSPLYEKEYRM